MAVEDSDGGAWAADIVGAIVWIDAESNQAEEPISLDGSPRSLVFGEGTLGR
jgi:hypothetical protein